MLRYTGTGTSGKAGVSARRSVVLRYLASCPPNELQIFMDLVLAPFKHLCTGELVNCANVVRLVSLNSRVDIHGSNVIIHVKPWKETIVVNWVFWGRVNAKDDVCSCFWNVISLVLLITSLTRGSNSSFESFSLLPENYYFNFLHDSNVIEKCQLTSPVHIYESN